MKFGEVKRLIMNMFSFGTVTQSKSKEGKALARVKLTERETDWLPVVSIANTFKRHWIPVRVKEQVIVFSPFGEASSGFIIRSIFFKGLREPSGSNEHTEVIEYEDGTRFTYDTKAKLLHVACVGNITIDAESVTINCDVTVNATITDTRGNLTNHKHLGFPGVVPLERS